MLLIQRWLNGIQNFTTGSILYEKYGNNKFLKDILNKRGDTPENKRLLEAALKELVDAEKVDVQEKVISKPETNILSNFDNMPESDDITLKTIQESWKRKYAEMNMLRHQLDAFEKHQSKETQEDAKNICFRILQLEQEINLIWSQRDYYLKHNKLPETKEIFDIPINAVELAKALETAKRNLRRNKAKLKSNPDNVKYAENCKFYEHQLNTLLNVSTKN